MSTLPTGLVKVEAAPTHSRDARANFVGLLRGELRKIAHLRITWIMAALYAVFIAGSQLVLAGGPDTASQLRADPVGSLYNVMEGDLSLVRIFTGIVLLVLTAHVIGLEYQYGTIRILLGRGVGRLQLLGAKVLALALVGLLLAALGVLIELLFAWGLVGALAGGTQPLRTLDAAYWTDVRFYALCVLISMGATLLLGVAASVVGRSLAFGLAVGLSWFAVDNLLGIPLQLMARFTHSDLWLKLTGFLLGPLLNRLPDYVAPPRLIVVTGSHGPQTVAVAVSGFGIQPLVDVHAMQALLVIAVYCAVFVVAAVLLTWRRDVRE
jgi:ABC-type transport system involved in multi-copper enzyme maturation permease subunit